MFNDDDSESGFDPNYGHELSTREDAMIREMMGPTSAAKPGSREWKKSFRSQRQRKNQDV